MSIDAEATDIAEAIRKIIDGQKPDKVMAALVAVTGVALFSIGVRPGISLDACMQIYERQIREHIELLS